MNNNELIKDQYRLIKEIGKGSFGYVYLVEDIKNNYKKYAMKRIHSNKLNESDYLLKAFKLELEVMKKCECENSVQLVEFFQTTHFHNIIMELCEGDLDSILKTRESGFTEEELKSILQQLNNVFKIMNRENIIHRDLKLKNILYISGNYNNDLNLKKGGLNLSEEFNEKPLPIKKDSIVIKLTDFGFSKVLDEDITSTKLGTPATMAPEIMMHTSKGYTNKVDLWSIGVISYQLLFKRLPFTGYNEQDLLNNIKTKPLNFPSGKKISEQCRDMLVRLLQIDPEQRIGWKEYYEHPFFRDENEEDNIDKYYSNFRKLSGDDTEFPMHKAKHIKTGEYVFIKIIDKKKLESNKYFKQIFLKECEILKCISCENSVKLIEICESQKNYYIITESFDGKRLDNFLKNRGSLSETFIRKIIRQIIPVLKEIDSQGKVLEFISPQSFWFKNYISEDNFCIKFYDYGLSSMYLDQNYQRNYLITEGIAGNIMSQKTNVLSFGLVIYMMIFGENLYQFSDKELPEETIKKKKLNKIKIPKQISNLMKNLLACTLNFNIEKRYDWKRFTDDPFIKIQYCEDIKTNPTSNIEGIHYFILASIKINDYQIETLSENILQKGESIYNYYISMLRNEKNVLEKMKFTKFIKEINSFIAILISQIRTFRNSILKNNINSSDSEIFLVSISKNDFDFSSFNFNSKINNLIINYENPILENFDKRLKSLEDDLVKLTISKKNSDNISEIECTTSLRNADSLAIIEKYFFKLLENAVMSFSKEDFSYCLEELLISKYLIETIIFFRLNVCSIEPRELTSDAFCKVLEECIIENSSFLFEEKKLETQVLNSENALFFSFLGAELKSFIKKKAIFIEKSEKSQDDPSFKQFIRFYMDIIKMINECDRRINQYK